MSRSHLKSTDYKASGEMPGGLSGRDMAFRIQRSPEHEDGSTERARTRRWTGTHDDLDLGGVVPVVPWHRDALCAEPAYEHVAFFGGKGRPGKKGPRSVCARCLVRDECLDDALSYEASVRLAFGIRGGLSADERMAIVREDRDNGTIYFGWGRGLVKIGTTRLDPAVRAQTYGVTLLATEPGSYTRERELHRWFAEDQAHGEWFNPSERLLAYIAALPDQVRHGQEVAA